MVGKNTSLTSVTFHRLENPSPNLSRQFAQVGKPAHATGSPKRREALIALPSLVGKGAGGLGLWLTFPHDVKSQVNL